MDKVVLSTSGDGYWSDRAKDVEVVNFKLGYVADEKDFGELCVYFNTEKWKVDEDGLIYTDSKFLSMLQAFLCENGLDGNDVEYSEQGMQGDDYVSCDVGEAFLKTWAAKFNINFDDMLAQQEKDFQEKFL